MGVAEPECGAAIGLQSLDTSEVRHTVEDAGVGVDTAGQGAARMRAHGALPHGAENAAELVQSDGRVNKFIDQAAVRR